MKPEDLLLFAADSARLMLESGGETYRAEEVAMGIISSQGGTEAECFATSTGLMLSFMAEDGLVHSIVRRVKRRGMNLERVSRIDTMLRDLLADRIDMIEAGQRLDAAERIVERPAPVKILASAAGAGFFTLLFGGNILDAVAAAVIGSAVACLILALSHLKLPDFVVTLAGGALAAGAASCLRAVGLVIHVDTTTIGIIMLMVPGVAITNAIRDIIAGDLVAGIARAADAFLTAAAISAGAGGSLALLKLLHLAGAL
ncbi:MAG: threonine/serine exporter family protein [Spirochaetes bacterium]|nr:threonine/serine exporter family protein [Spirochaetota bacterium]